MWIIVARLDEDLSNKSSVLSVLDLMPEAVRNATSVCPLQKAKCCDETFFAFLFSSAATCPLLPSKASVHLYR